ncbi:MAG: hypothetical protein JXA54_09795 [Candidatus Heimdallarchaeota archaeon]|nr:hypothetical protein [Candidatus Heimdallarchaeota archaeon]
MPEKPISLCLIQMGKTGLELVRAYPEVIPAQELNQIVIKSMPLGAKEGDFITTSVGDSVISGYIFSVPGETRNNIVSLTVVYNSMDFNQQMIKKVFSTTITELKKNNVISTELFSSMLPKMFDGLVTGRLKLKISSVVTLDLEVDHNISNKEAKNKFDDFNSDIW